MAEKEPLAYQAAKASWMAPLIAIGLSIATNVMVTGDSHMEEGTVRTVRFAVGLIGVAIVLAGLVFGVIALFGIKQHGAKGILVPSIIGILLCSGFIYLLVQAFMLAQQLKERGGMPP
jgi:hypothetical protein